MRSLPSLLTPLALVFAGCITHLPVRTTEHLRIHWEPDYATALATATRTYKPLLVLLVAGELDGPS